MPTVKKTSTPRKRTGTGTGTGSRARNSSSKKKTAKLLSNSGNIYINILIKYIYCYRYWNIKNDEFFISMTPISIKVLCLFILSIFQISDKKISELLIYIVQTLSSDINQSQIKALYELLVTIVKPLLPTLCVINP